MGRTFIDHCGGNRPVVCLKCSTALTNKDYLESIQYQGSTGGANLYSKAINLRYGELQQRDMLTGRHYVKDVYCKGCGGKLGWMYEFAVPEEQRHKEGKVILERACIKEVRRNR